MENQDSKQSSNNSRHISHSLDLVGSTALYFLLKTLRRTKFKIVLNSYESDIESMILMHIEVQQ